MPLPKRRTVQRRVAMFFDTSRAFARGFIHGVGRYNRERQQWSIYYCTQDADGLPPAWLKDWKGYGILARIQNRRMAEAILRVGVPVVDLWGEIDGLEVSRIDPDDAAVARLAVEHLLDRGFRNFGFFGPPRGYLPTTDARADHFQRLVREAGFQCSALYALAGLSARSWEKDLARTLQWLRGLRKPAGVLACNDDRGLQLLDACRRAGILVPDEVAVIGVANDDCLCSLAVPPLTSIDLNPQRIGYEAARLLDQVMASKHRRPRHELVEPRGIVVRMSSDVLAVEDAAVAQAVRFIREHACDDIRLSDVLQQVHASRKVLEPRFRQALGRTVHQEIQRVRIERVKELLALSSAPLKQIAVRAGFRYPEYMMQVFRRITGQTPTEYRRGVLQ